MIYSAKQVQRTNAVSKIVSSTKGLKELQTKAVSIESAIKGLEYQN